jgi:hypothetical protein
MNHRNWPTGYYALRLMIASGKSDAARDELDLLLERNESDLPLGSRKLLNQERLKLTTSLEDFLRHVPEVPVPSGVDFNTGKEVPADSAQTKPAQPLFNRYAAETLGGRHQDTPQEPKAMRCEEVGSLCFDGDHAEDVSRTPRDLSADDRTSQNSSERMAASCLLTVCN